jgi:hypothetical protein
MSRQMLGTTQTERTCCSDMLDEAGLFVFDRGAASWRRVYFYFDYACVPGRSLHARRLMPD